MPQQALRRVHERCVWHAAIVEMSTAHTMHQMQLIGALWQQHMAAVLQTMTINQARPAGVGKRGCT